MNKQSLVRTGLRAAAVLALAALAACETAPEIRTQTAPNANVAAYRTYGYVASPGTDRGGYTSINTRYIEAAVDREMQARGYVPSSSNPDLLVNFNIASKDKVEGTTSPRTSVGVGYGGWGWRRGYGYGVGIGIGDTDIRTVTEGTLTVDVVDAARKELLWTGSAVGRITKEIRTNPQPTIDKAVSLIFAKYPKPAG